MITIPTVRPALRGLYPWRPGRCPACNVLVLVAVDTAGRRVQRDPSEAGRAIVAERVGPVLVRRHGFGDGLGKPHLCERRLRP